MFYSNINHGDFKTAFSMHSNNVTQVFRSGCLTFEELSFTEVVALASKLLYNYVSTLLCCVNFEWINAEPRSLKYYVVNLGLSVQDSG